MLGEFVLAGIPAEMIAADAAQVADTEDGSMLEPACFDLLAIGLISPLGSCPRLRAI